MGVTARRSEWNRRGEAPDGCTARRGRSVRVAGLFVAACVLFPGCNKGGSGEPDYAEAVRIECGYITQCSMSAANPTVRVSESAPGYGAINEWRIGNGAADSMNPGTSAIGMVGLLYGYNRLVLVAGGGGSVLDPRVRTALRAFFRGWLVNGQNRTVRGDTVGFPRAIRYDSAGSVIARDVEANAGVTSELLIAMNKYRRLSPNGDRAEFEAQMYGTALAMARFVDGDPGAWTSDRSYAVAAFRGVANWADALGDAASAQYYRARAAEISEGLAAARDEALGNYFSNLDTRGAGVYDRGNVDQVGFAPYEFNARDADEAFAQRVADFWDSGTYGGQYMTVQEGPYAGGVHQRVPQWADRAFPGPSFQLADMEWKAGRKEDAWWHYAFALSPQGSAEGSGCWVRTAAYDGFAGGFIDWVDAGGNRPSADYQRFVDTSGYMLVATEELVFDSEVDWAD